jgi:hypothetical protein
MKENIVDHIKMRGMTDQFAQQFEDLLNQRESEGWTYRDNFAQGMGIVFMREK